MSWSTKATTNHGLIQGLKQNGIVKNDKVYKALLAVDRLNFSKDANEAYNDNPHGIGYGQTISAPHMHAYALEYLAPHIPDGEEAKILDVGCGSGYLLAAFAEMCPKAKIFGIEIVPELVEFSITNLNKQNPVYLSSKRVSVKQGSGWKSVMDDGPFDVIHVGAAAASIPEELIKALKVHGRLFIPVGPDGGNQELLFVEKLNDKNEIKTQSLLGVRYVPLVNK